MAYSATYDRVISVNGVMVQERATQSCDNAKGCSVALSAAIAGTLTTRTDNDTGVVTVASGHGITASDTVIVTWESAGVRYNRYNVDVTGVTSTTISIDLGAGTNLPSSSTAVTIVIQRTEDCNLGSVQFTDLKALLFKGSGDYILVIETDDSGTEYHAYTVDADVGLGFVSGSSAPDGTAMTFDDVFTGIDPDEYIKKLHFGNIATTTNNVSANILHN